MGYLDQKRQGLHSTPPNKGTAKNASSRMNSVETNSAEEEEAVDDKWQVASGGNTGAHELV
jgi:hypothetical protein